MKLLLWFYFLIDFEDSSGIYQEQIDHLEDLITRTLTHGESNSALLVGARGTGKSAVCSD